ncbi:MAG: Cyclic pyranopterin phosphate synthase (MoaA), partial [uncultured Blastococcus sp.]
GGVGLRRGHHRGGDQAVLRRLRPGPADRRRPGPELPLRAGRVRSADPTPRRRLRRGARRPLGHGRGRQACRSRHRRPDVPAAGSADVRDRRL